MKAVDGDSSSVDILENVVEIWFPHVSLGSLWRIKLSFSLTAFISREMSGTRSGKLISRIQTSTQKRELARVIGDKILLSLLIY